MDFTVITPTGDRPEAFELCKHYVSRQTVTPKKWIVIDDGEIPGDTVPEIKYAQYIRRNKKSIDPKHTLPLQMLEAFKYVDTDYVLIMEDDDWYAPNYCENILPLLDGYALAGFIPAIYYNIPQSKYSVRKNTTWTTWCQTAFNSLLIPEIEKIINLDLTCYMIDVKTWKLNVKKNLCKPLKNLCVGIKGLSGREGLTMGWNNSILLQDFKKDTNYFSLKKLVGNDFDRYKKWTIQ